MFNQNSGSASRERQTSSDSSAPKTDQLPVLNPLFEAVKSVGILGLVFGDIVFNGGKHLQDYVNGSHLDN